MSLRVTWSWCISKRTERDDWRFDREKPVAIFIALRKDLTGTVKKRRKENERNLR